MAIDGWMLKPEAIKGVLDAVQVQAGELGGKLSDTVFEGLSAQLVATDGECPVNGITGQVPQAINNLMTDQSAALKGLFDRISASAWGVVGAANEYQNGNEAMAKEALSAANTAAASGNLQYFTTYGYVPPATDGSGPQ